MTPEENDATGTGADGVRVLPGVVVAIDGPSGSGKSTVSRRVASALGLRYVDTGAMYRALTWWCLEQGLDLNDAAAVARASRELPLELGNEPTDPYVRVDGEDISQAIRESRISTQVSAVATNLDVRENMRQRQRDLIGTGGVVAEGRDITTVVAPDAHVRVLLTASEDARLARRARELHGSDDESVVDSVRDQVVRRDRDDSTVSEFSSAADGVVTVDSSHLSLDQTVSAVLKLVAAVSRGQ